MAELEFNCIFDEIMYTERTIEKFIHKANKQFPVLLIIGPRQIGKITCLLHMRKDNRNYVTLDDPILATLAKNEQIFQTLK